VNGLTRRGALGGALTAVLGIAMAVVAAVVLDAVFGLDKSQRNGIASLLIVIALLLGGFRAGLLEPLAPLTNGAAAGVIASLPLHLIRVVQRLRAHQSIPVVWMLFVTLLAASLGVFGGLVANSSNRQRQSR
jgi:hypothetical protein